MANANPLDYLYPEDITGAAATNKVVGERRTLNPPEEELDFHFILPWAGPFFRDTMKITHIPTGQPLLRGVHWAPGHRFNSASYELQNTKGGIYASILFFDRTLSGQISLDEYQTLGGAWTLDENKILEIMSNRVSDPRLLTYEEVNGKPTVFPPTEHNHPADDLTGFVELIAATYDVSAAIRQKTDDWLANPPILMGEYYDRDEVDAKLLEGNYERLVNRGNLTGAVQMDGTAADVYLATCTGPITWNFLGRPLATDQARYFELRLTNGGAFAQTWPAGTRFPNGDKDLTANGIDKLIIVLAKDYTDITVVREMA